MVNWRSLFSSDGRSQAEGLAASTLLRAFAATALLGCSACGGAQEPAAATAAATGPICAEAAEGELQARLQGAIEGEIDWSAGGGHCLGGVRPDGTGLRMVFKGAGPAGEPLLIVIGAGPVAPGTSARNVPANVTVVVEGSGRFYATQGDDKCALDTLQQEPVSGEKGLLRVAGRGYCIQPARAVGGDGSVLISRFDLLALVREQPEATEPDRWPDQR